MIFNADRVPVRLSTDDKLREVTAITEEGHMLVGVRKWRVIDTGEMIRIETETYDQIYGWGNCIGSYPWGKPAPGAVWTDCLTNIGNDLMKTHGGAMTPVKQDDEDVPATEQPWRHRKRYAVGPQEVRKFLCWFKPLSEIIYLQYVPSY